MFVQVSKLQQDMERQEQRLLREQEVLHLFDFKLFEHN